MKTVYRNLRYTVVFLLVRLLLLFLFISFAQFFNDVLQFQCRSPGIR